MQAEPFDLRWLTDTLTSSPESLWRKVWSSEGRFPVLPKLRVSKEPAGSTVAGL